MCALFFGNLISGAVKSMESYMSQNNSNNTNELKILQDKLISIIKEKLPECGDEFFNKNILSKYDKTKISNVLSYIYSADSLPDSIFWPMVREDILSLSFEDKIKHFNIVILGKAGVGKSTLVNCVLGEKVAKTGDGESVTRGKPKPYEKGMYRLYDTQGIDDDGYGIKEIDEDIRELISKAALSGTPDLFVHCIWYCVGGCRFETSEKEVLIGLREIYDDSTLPIIVVYTQAYDEDRAKDIINQINFIIKKKKEKNDKNYEKENNNNNENKEDKDNDIMDINWLDNMCDENDNEESNITDKNNTEINNVDNNNDIDKNKENNVDDKLEKNNIDVVKILAEEKEIKISGQKMMINSFGIQELLSLTTEKISLSVKSACFYSFKKLLLKNFSDKLYSICKTLKEYLDKRIAVLENQNKLGSITNYLNNMVGVIYKEICVFRKGNGKIGEKGKKEVMKVLGEYKKECEGKLQEFMKEFTIKCSSILIQQLSEEKEKNVIKSNDGIQNNNDNITTSSSKESSENINSYMSKGISNYMLNNSTKSGKIEDDSWKKLEIIVEDFIFKKSVSFFIDTFIEECVKIANKTYDKYIQNLGTSIEERVKSAMINLWKNNNMNEKKENVKNE